MRLKHRNAKWAIGAGALAAAALFASVLVLAPIASATFPGDNGRIAFMRPDRHGVPQIWTANAELRGQVKLTSGSATSGWPVWSPDGMKLAFDSDRADPDPVDSEAINDIFVMNSDGSGVVKLTDSQGFSGDAAWSPDGSLIAFDSDRGQGSAKQGIYVMNADGSDPRRITSLPPHAALDFAPRFSPDGARLVFTRLKGSDETETGAVFTVGVDGGDLRRLTPFGIHAADADWSPDGSRIVFEAHPDPRTWEIYTIHADGTHLRNVTRNRRVPRSCIVDGEPLGCDGLSNNPVWSPDGKKILFYDARVRHRKFMDGLATMNPDGSARRFLSRTPKADHQPDWESIPTPPSSPSGG